LDALPNDANTHVLYSGYGHMLIGKGDGRIYDLAPGILVRHSGLAGSQIRD